MRARRHGGRLRDQRLRQFLQFVAAPAASGVHRRRTRSGLRRDRADPDDHARCGVRRLLAARREGFLKIDTQGSEWLALQGARGLLSASKEIALLLEFWPYALRGAKPEQLLAFLFEQGFTVGKATEAPYPMSAERILRQALARDPVRGGIDLYATRGVPFHVTSFENRVRGLWRSIKEP